MSFFSSQILWVLTLFFALGLPLGASTMELHSLLITIIGYILYSVVYLCILSQFIFKVDNLNRNLKKLKLTLAELEDEGENMTKLIRALENLEPVSGYGLFTMDRTTLTSMISVSITYVIILVQFKQNFVESS